jgi:cellobiose phosphorylase
MVEYGHFDDSGLEYVILRPDTPRPWCNYLFNKRYCALISHTGGGYSFIDASGYDRSTRAYPGEMVLADRPGRWIYVRDNDTGEFWSINWQPVRHKPDRWETRHGLGYTVISSSYRGIEGRIRYFVPLHQPLEIWTVTVANHSGRPRLLSLFSFQEFSLGNYVTDLVERSFFDLFNEIRVEKGIILATKRLWVKTGPHTPNEVWDKWAFVTTNGRATAFDTVREAFIGPYRSHADPIAVERGQCSNSVADGVDAVAVLQFDLALGSGEEATFDILAGIVDRKPQATELRDMYSLREAVEQEFQQLRAFWKDYLDRLTVQTPDPDFNLSVNVWNKYQCWVTAHWSRMVSPYIGGGSIFGFRDTAQDILGILPTDPEMARERTILILRHQFADGGCIHNWDPITDTGPRTGHSDDPLWLVMAVINYLKESGDFEFLNLEVPYYDMGRGTVLEHMTRALEYAYDSRSPRGLSLMGAADWNDGLDQVGRKGRGESVMTSQFLAWMLREAADLMDAIGDSDTASLYRERFEEVRDAINRWAWDGQWYWRGTLDNGEVFGSSMNQEGRIYLNPQSWSVLSQVAPIERAISAMDSVKELLDTPYGPALLLPAYSRPDPQIGIITRFVPGTKENGTIFNHPVCWAVIAECILKRAERAYEYWKKTSFLTRGREPQVYKAEPYVYAEYVYGPDHPNFGQGEFTWTTGTAAWMWRACIDWILGIRPAYRGLLVDPCIPSHWKEYTVQRRFRGATYIVSVQNPEGVHTGIKELWLDGHRLEGSLIPPLEDGGSHRVIAVMGTVPQKALETGEVR